MCGTSEILLSLPQKERRTEQVHNDDDSVPNARNPKNSNYFIQSRIFTMLTNEIAVTKPINK
jgi:hypothetical protein